MPRARLARLVSAVVSISLAALAGAASAAENHPFGSQPMTYAGGSIRPNHVSQATLDQTVRDFYDAWKERYLVQACGAGQYVVEARVSSGNLTVSEAHGYGMMLAALMAGHDPEARAIFDGMYAYFRDHPTATHDHLMSWNQKKSCANAEGNDSATDGDLDIAYALLLADKQWGSCGAVDYAAEAAEVLADLEDGALDTSGQYVLLGDWVDPLDSVYYPSTRSSDFMPGHLKSFAAASSNPVWTAVLDQTYQVIDDLQTTYSPTTGLLPDFIVDPLGAPAPAAPGFLEGALDGDYSYNACRDPWRIATDYLVSGETRAKTAADRITSWARSSTSEDPTAIKSGYQLDGTFSVDEDYLSMAFVAPLGVGAMTDAGNQTWLNDIWDLAVDTSIDAEGYYENTLKLLALIVMSGNWWAPEAVAGGCTPTVTPLCTDGGYVGSPSIAVGGLASGAGRQSIKLKASLFFPQGIPATAPYTDGAQILLEDVGNGDAPIFDRSHLTIPVPALADGVCDARDGWTVKPALTQYRNSSTALDPPVCTAGSASGLQRIKYRQRSARTLDVQVKVKGVDIPTVLGPLRATLVLGSTNAAGDAGHCAVSASVLCTAAGNNLRCK